MTIYVSTMKKGIEHITEYVHRIEDPEQKHCECCERPINKNCAKSTKMEGMCGKCYRTNIKESDRRLKNKNIVKYRKSERRIKQYSMEY